MALINLIDNFLTDKNTTHSYLETYEKLLYPKKDSAKNVLEIGIGDFHHQNGGSILLWYKYFTDATIYGLDILDDSRVINTLKNNERIKLITSVDAYNEDIFKENLLDKDIKFDVIIDDGPHTLESMKQFIKLYTQVLSDDGILIVEDVQDISWTDELKKLVPENLKQYIEIYDLRSNKYRYDDILFVIDKSKEINV